MPALSTEIVKQSQDTKGFVVLPRRWVGRHPGLLGLAGTGRFDRNRRCSRVRRPACVQRAAASASAGRSRGAAARDILVAPPADREPFQRERNRLSGGVQNPAGIRRGRCWAETTWCRHGGTSNLSPAEHCRRCRPRRAGNGRYLSVVLRPPIVQGEKVPTGTSTKPMIKLKPTKVSTFGSTANLIVAAIATVKMLPIKKPIAVV